MTQKFTPATIQQLRDEAEGGSMQAQFALAEAYINGNGVAKNLEEGLSWLQEAAEQGRIAAQCDLGVMYQKGIGVKQDYKETCRWLTKAAEQGDAFAQHNLGSLNAKGFKLKGMGFFNRDAFAFMVATQNFVEAYKWFTIAAANGIKRSLRDRKIISMRMSSLQVTRAEELARAYFESAKHPVFTVHFEEGDVESVRLSPHNIAQWAASMQSAGRAVEAICDEEAYVVWPPKDAGFRIFYS